MKQIEVDVEGNTVVRALSVENDIHASNPDAMRNLRMQNAMKGCHRSFRRLSE